MPVMTSYVVGRTLVIAHDLDDFTEEEAARYVEYVKERTPPEMLPLKVWVTAGDNGKVNIDYELAGPKFERIRRITGYLTGSIDTWNDSKRAEVKDRVVHGLTEGWK